MDMCGGRTNKLVVVGPNSQVDSKKQLYRM